jgi:hypothetical protein
VVVMMATLKGGGQVVNVGGGQAQGLNLGQLPILRMGGDQVSEKEKQIF